MKSSAAYEPLEQLPPVHPKPADEHLLAVAEVGRELAAHADVDRRLARALEALDRHLGAERSVLYVGTEGERPSLLTRAVHGVAADHFRPRAGMGVAGRVAQSGQPVVVPVVRHDAMAQSELADLALWYDTDWNLVAVPVESGGRSLGALCVYFRHRGAVADRVGVLGVIASLLARTIEASRLRSLPLPLEDAPRAEEASPGRSPQELFEYANMVGASAAMRQVYELISQVARTNATALLRGESGTGKELVARAIHDNSPRVAAPFVKVNCAALPEDLFESELFGHERGAFTGAHARKKGRFELAEGGTLFLDEIGELSLRTQAKLLRALQFREFERVGGTETLHADVRLIAATNADMERAVELGTFREDLYYRIHIFTITLPSLRERRADIPALAEYFLSRLGAEHGRKISRISSAALDLLTRHAWPGNVRELENVIERAVVVCDGAVIQKHHLPAALTAAPAPEQLTLAQAVERLERSMVDDALRAQNGNVAAAARVLGTTERIVRYKAQKLGLDSARYRR
jgi:Nif-specific regulatory protein